MLDVCDGKKKKEENSRLRLNQIVKMLFNYVGLKQMIKARNFFSMLLEI